MCPAWLLRRPRCFREQPGSHERLAAHAFEQAARKPAGRQPTRSLRGENRPCPERRVWVARLSALSKYETGAAEQKIQRMLRISAVGGDSVWALFVSTAVRFQRPTKVHCRCLSVPSRN